MATNSGMSALRYGAWPLALMLMSEMAAWRGFSTALPFLLHVFFFFSSVCVFSPCYVCFLFFHVFFCSKRIKQVFLCLFKMMLFSDLWHVGEIQDTPQRVSFFSLFLRSLPQNLHFTPLEPSKRDPSNYLFR